MCEYLRAEFEVSSVILTSFIQGNWEELNNWEEVTKNICYILQFIDSARFMASSLSSLVNNLSEKIHRINLKFGHNDKKCWTCEMKYKYSDSFLEYINIKDDLIEHKFLCCNNNYQHKFDEKLKEWFFSTYIFSNHDNKKSILLLQKGVYPYEYMDDWETLSETLLPEKDNFHSHLVMEDITDADYAHAKRVCEDFEIKHLGEYHELYVQSDTLMLANVFGNFRNVHHAKFLSAPVLPWQAALKKSKVKLDLLPDIYILLMV